MAMGIWLGVLNFFSRMRVLRGNVVHFFSFFFFLAELSLCVPTPFFQAKEQSTMAQRAEIIVDERSLTSGVISSYGRWYF